MAKKTFEGFFYGSRSGAGGQCLVDPGEPTRLFGRAPVPSRGWALLCGYDERGFAVMIQKAADDRDIMARAGCRWKSLKNARAHWISAARNRNAKDRRTAKQILMLIGIGVTRARGKGWTTKKFNSNPRKHSHA